MPKTYVIDNGEERHALYPDTFYIPPREVRESLEPGDYIKACFREPGNDHGERMWLEIIAVGEGEYRAKLDNDPVLFPDLECGEELTIRPEHVINVMKRSTPPGEDPLRAADLTHRIRRSLKGPLKRKTKPHGD